MNQMEIIKIKMQYLEGKKFLTERNYSSEEETSMTLKALQYNFQKLEQRNKTNKQKLTDTDPSLVVT